MYSIAGARAPLDVELPKEPQSTAYYRGLFRFQENAATVPKALYWPQYTAEKHVLAQGSAYPYVAYAYVPCGIVPTLQRMR